MNAQAMRKSAYEAAEPWAPKPSAPRASAPHDDAALEAFAADELSHALGHDWIELEGLAPFSDEIPCDPESGQPYAVVRSYRWAEHEGGDLVCEVTVYASPDREGHFVRRRCVLRKG